ncbi:MAG: hypothetical protein ACOYN3_07425 [Acidimicrobiia bacterium]
MAETRKVTVIAASGGSVLCGADSTPDAPFPSPDRLVQCARIERTRPTEAVRPKR